MQMLHRVVIASALAVFAAAANANEYSAATHRIVVGDFNGDNRDDVFLQGAGPSTVHAVMLADSNGQFTSTTPHQTWNDGYLGFAWSVTKALVHAGRFNSDARDDLLIQAKPDIVIIDYDVPFPVPRFRPNSFGIVLALDPAGGALFRSGSVQQFWSRNHLSADWSAANTNLVVGDFNGDGRDDVFLQSRNGSRINTLHFSDVAGQFTQTNGLVDTSAQQWSGSQYQLTAGNFDGTGAVGLYLQGTTAANQNYLSQNVSVAGVSVAQHNIGSSAPVTPGTAPGAISGEFTVDPSGAASYRIPIAVPPGVAGTDPEIALVYSSRGSNGLVGVGFDIAGLSAITRCPTTHELDGFNDGVDFDGNDRFCLDGQRLVVMNAAAYGAVGASYRTELESFQDVAAVGGAAGDPSSFKVRDKSGLERIYGTDGGSRVLASGVGQALSWQIRQLKDRYNNYISFEYEQVANLSHARPTQIRYGSTGYEVGRIEFVYEDRGDTNVGYVAGATIGMDKRLKKIVVYSRADQNATGANVRVREYHLAYEVSPVTNHSHVRQVIQCDGGTGTAQKCLGATSFNWQHGYRGFSDPINTNVSASGWNWGNTKVVDFNADGRLDLAYSNGSGRWEIRSGGIDVGASATTLTARTPPDAVVVDFNNDGYQDILQYGPSTTLEAVLGTATGLSGTSTSSIPNAMLTPSSRFTAVADVDGDGRQDLVKAQYSDITVVRNGASGLGAGVTNTYPLGGAPPLGPTCETSYVEVMSATPTDPAVFVVNFDGGSDDLLVKSRGVCHYVDSMDIPRTVYSQEGLRLYRWNATSATYEYVARLAMPTSFRVKPTDMNGDGVTDLMMNGGGLWHAYVATGNATTPFTYAWNASQLTYTQRVDLNWGAFDQYQDGTTTTEYQVTVNLTDTLWDQAQFFDYDRNGRADVLIPVNGTWRAMLSNGSAYNTTILDTGRAATNPAQTVTFDNRSDGLPDLMWAEGGTHRLLYSRGPVSGLLEMITDGYGARTQIQYGLMTDSNVYKGPQDVVETGAAPTFPLQHFAAPIPLVFKFSADNGRTAGSSATSSGAILTSYEYYGMKFHRAGRGWVGFSEVRSWNDNAAIQTINRFFQTFPYTGMVATTEQKFPDITTYKSYLAGDLPPNLLMNYISACETNPTGCSGIWPSAVTVTPGNRVAWSTSTVSHKSWTDGRKFPYVLTSTELKYPVRPSGTQPAAFKRTFTEYLNTAGGTTSPYDDAGNPLRIRVTVDDGANGDAHVVDTVNTYDTPDWTEWCLGRLTRTAVTHTRKDYANGNTAPVSITRESTFEYYPAPKCLLWKEHTEPTAAAGALRLTKTYTYDAFGNKASVHTSGGGGLVSRTASTSYDVAGQLPVSITNALGHTEQHTYDPRFGTQTSLTGPNGLVTNWGYDSFGRRTQERVPGSAGQLTTTTDYYWCKTFVSCDSRAVVAIRTVAPDGSYAWSELDRLGREVRNRRVAFSGVEIITEAWYDPLGRKYLVVAPYTATQSQCWSFSTFDQVGRVTTQWAPSSQAECTTTRASDGSPLPYDATVPVGGKRTDFVYDEVRADGITVTATLAAANAPTRKTLKSYNRMDRLRFVRDALNNDVCTTNGANCITQEYDYDPVGNTSLVKDANGAATHVLYNVRGFKTEMRDPNMGTWTYGYDVLGQLLTQVDAKNQTTSIGYDLLGRITSRTETNPSTGSEGTVNWYYDEGAPAQKTRGKLTRLITTTGFEEHYTYDSLSRLVTTRRVVDGTNYWVDTTYDALNRIDTLVYPNSVSSSSSSSAGPLADRFRVRHVYNTYGFLQAVQEVMPNGGAGTTYWTAATVDESGVVTREDLGNGRSTIRTVDRATGNLTALTTGTGVGTEIQNLQFEWDGVGNLRVRRDFRARNASGAREEFTYDGLHRLYEARRYDGASGTFGAAGAVSTDVHTYDAVGNLLSKGSQYTGYNYASNGTCTRTWSHAQPHAVRQVTANGTLRQYCYDANGNAISATNATFQTMTWTVANLAKLITRSASESAEFWYDPNRARYKNVARYNGTTETTVYVGTIYEKKTVGSTVEHVHYVRDGNDTIAVIRRAQGSTSNAVNYLHRDHLGSVVATTTATGALSERMAFDAWGKRRNDASWSTPPAGQFISRTSATNGPIPSERRGYTGHEHIDQIGLVHMNARVYDPELGRFLSADPTVQFPEGTQGFNRYTYTGNNPLTYYDPSGFSFWKKLMAVVGVVVSIVQPWSSAWVNGFVSGFLSSGGNIKQGLIGGLSAGLFSQIGTMKGIDTFSRAVLHGLVGGAASLASGGRFGEGFLGAFGSKLVMAGLNGFDPYRKLMGRMGDGDFLNTVKRTAVAAIVGGSLQALGGGKFLNGAVTAAFAHLYNGERSAAKLALNKRERAYAAGVLKAEMEAASAIETEDEFYKRYPNMGSPAGDIGWRAAQEAVRDSLIREIYQLEHSAVGEYTIDALEWTLNLAVDKGVLGPLSKAHISAKYGAQGELWYERVDVAKDMFEVLKVWAPPLRYGIAFQCTQGLGGCGNFRAVPINK